MPLSRDSDIAGTKQRNDRNKYKKQWKLKKYIGMIAQKCNEQDSRILYATYSFHKNTS